jgi:hypothetical protein
LTGRLCNFPTKDTEKQNEKDIIKQILHNNKYDTAILNKLNLETTKTEEEYEKEKSRNKMGESYLRWEAKQVYHKSFKNSNLKIYFKTKILQASY